MRKGRGIDGTGERRVVNVTVEDKKERKSKKKEGVERSFSPSLGINTDISGHKSDNYNGIKQHNPYRIGGRPHAFMTERSLGLVHCCPTFQSRIFPTMYFLEVTFLAKLWDP